MASHASYEAVILRTHDVGEADRFCILFTRERGKIAARAQGVRRLHSRMAGCLLAPNHVEVDICERQSGLLLTSARLARPSPSPVDALSTFSRVQQGMELLLRLVDDEDPLPDVFDLVLQFSRLSSETLDPLPAFQLRLLHLLGLLPTEEHEPRVKALSTEDRSLLRTSAASSHLATIVHAGGWNNDRLYHFRTNLLAEHLVRPLQAERIAPFIERGL